MRLRSRPRPSIAILPALALIAVGWPLSALAADRCYSWTAVPGAAYYQGTLGEGDAAVKVRTSQTWVMLPPGTSLHLDAYAADGHELAPVTVAPGTPPARVASAAAAEAPAETPPPQAHKKKKKKPKDDDLEAAAATPAAKAKVAAEDTEKPTPALAHAALALDLGKETLAASGGASEYNGSANVAGVALSADYQPQASSWLFDVAGEGHVFETVTTVQPPGGGAGAQVTSKPLQLRLTAGAFFDFAAQQTDGPGPLRAALGVGLIHVRMPVLKVSDPTTGEAALADVDTTRPFVGAQLAYRTSQRNELGLDLDDAPVTLETSPKLTSLDVGAHWRHRWTRHLYSALGVGYTRDTASISVTCPAVANCQTSSAATATEWQGSLGLGARW